MDRKTRRHVSVHSREKLKMVRTFETSQIKQKDKKVNILEYHKKKEKKKT